MFSDLILRDPPAVPDMGVYCFVSFGSREQTYSGVLNAYFAFQYALLHIPFINLFLMAGVLPNYADEGGTTVCYSLYRDGQPRKTYHYPITKKGGG